MAKEKMADGQISQAQGHDGLHEPGVTGVYIGVLPAGGPLAGQLVAADTAAAGLGIAADQLTDGGPLPWPGGDLLEAFVKHRDPYPGYRVEILQQGGEFFEVKGRYHGSSFPGRLHDSPSVNPSGPFSYHYNQMSEQNQSFWNVFLYLFLFLEGYTDGK